ncbi:DUF397 domain-containing protein [Micromonospora humida]|uniref:DUF397 domain-containing protein n=1 Tax=Micromonospora humida TaxID=2809018 RepID=UPI0035575B55
MAALATPDRGWFKSSRSSDHGACVEVRFVGGAVDVRDTKRTAPALCSPSTAAPGPAS